MSQPPPTPPSAPSAPPSPKKISSPRATLPDAVPLEITAGPVAGGDRLVIYGTGGIGKSTLAAYLPGPLFLDCERGTRKMNVSHDFVGDWPTLRGKLATIAASPPSGVQSVVIDTATAAEEFAKEHVLDTRKTEKGKQVDSIEGFGWGKGWQFVYDEFSALLADLDRIVDRHGINVCLITHVVSSPVPNPLGEDYIRWEPLIYSGDKKGRGSIRERIKNWSDFMLFIAYDVAVDEGKGIGSGSRSVYTYELPTHVAKSRSVQDSFTFEKGDPGAIWRALGVLPS